jgi:hypothetical protein
MKIVIGEEVLVFGKDANVIVEPLTEKAAANGNCQNLQRTV